jgi:hypothetical protein
MEACTSLVESPFDAFCSEGHPLFLTSSARGRMVILNAGRAGLASLAIVAASAASPLPLVAVTVVVGIAVVLAGLRAFRIPRAIAVAAWLAAIVGITAYDRGWLSDAGGRGLLTALVVAVVSSGVIAVAVDTAADATRDVAAQIAATAATAFVACELLAAAAATGLVRDLAWAESALVVAGVSSAASIAGVAAVAGFARGAARIDTNVRRFGEPRTIPPFELEVPARRGGATGLEATLTSLGRVVILTANRIVAVCWHAAYALVRVCVRSASHIHRWLVIAGRALAAAAADAAAIVGAGVKVAVAVLQRWAMSTVAPLVVVGGGALAGVVASDRFSDYLAGGSLVDGWLGLVLWAVMAIALIALWWCLTNHDRRVVQAAAGRFAARAAPPAFLTLVAVGWADGILGLVGVGPMRPGPLTIAGTAILALSTVFVLRAARVRREADT